MAYNMHAGTSSNTRKIVPGSVLGENGTAAIEQNPQGQTEAQEEEEKKRSGRGYRSKSTKKGYTAADLPTATFQEDYINGLYEAKLSKERLTLENAYDANVTALEQSAAKIPGQYQAERNQTAGDAAVQKAAFHEQAAASGLNSGARGQAALAQNNALLGKLTAIRQAEREALDEIAAQRTALQQQYQRQIAEAVAANEIQRAEALYNEAKRVDESIVDTAVKQANENYKAWKSIYG